MADLSDRSDTARTQPPSATTTATAGPTGEPAIQLIRRAVAEALGTAFLVAIVIGSGIYAERLTTDPGLRLLENSIATGAGLVALILAFGPVSGAHFNPVVTLADLALGGIGRREVLAYIPAQILGGCVGAVAANLMFELDAVNISRHARSSGAL
jgi:glycerol uptake facilitator-like aquaporin